MSPYTHQTERQTVAPGQKEEKKEKKIEHTKVTNYICLNYKITEYERA